MNLARLSALRTGNLFAPGNIYGTHFCYRLSTPRPCPVEKILFYSNPFHFIYFISSTKTKSMAMWGNYIQRVKIVINDNIIEQATDFKYLGYRISE